MSNSNIQKFYLEIYLTVGEGRDIYFYLVHASPTSELSFKITDCFMDCQSSKKGES